MADYIPRYICLPAVTIQVLTGPGVKYVDGDQGIATDTNRQPYFTTMNVAVNRKTALTPTPQSPENCRRHLSTAEDIRTPVHCYCCCLLIMFNLSLLSAVCINLADHVNERDPTRGIINYG